MGASREEIEDRILKERIAKFSVDPAVTDWRVRTALQSRFAAEKGEKLAKDLLRKLKTEKLENERNDDFVERIRREAEPILEPKELTPETAGGGQK